MNADDYAEDLEEIRTVRGYGFSDQITISPDTLPDFDNQVKSFFSEHLHGDEEVRFIIDGSGYLDFRDKEDRWVRIVVEKGDLLILPAGIYHRFSLDINNYIKAIRLFKEDQKWTPHNRPAEQLPSRQEFVKTFLS